MGIGLCPRQESVVHVKCVHTCVASSPALFGRRGMKRACMVLSHYMHMRQSLPGDERGVATIETTEEEASYPGPSRGGGEGLVHTAHTCAGGPQKNVG